MNPGYRLADRCLAPPRIAQLSLGDNRQVQAALGWIELGIPAEAEAELALLTSSCQTHPEVLRVRYLVCEALNDWERAAEVSRTICHCFPSSPYGWNQLAYALHQLKRTAEAYDLLLPVAPSFPAEAAIPYNLACYSCTLGKLEEAWQWLCKSIEVAGIDEIKNQGMVDPDLTSLWPAISEL